MTTLPLRAVVQFSRNELDVYRLGQGSILAGKKKNEKRKKRKSIYI